MGGNCLTARYCMQPCARKATYNGKVFATETYAYEPTGQLREGKISTILPATGRTMAQSHVCAYDARAHRAQCTFGEVETRFAYEHGRLVGSQVQRADAIERRTHVHDARGRLVRTTRVADVGEVTIDFTYNPDGSLATMHDLSNRAEVTRTFSYDGGRLARITMTPDGTVMEYRYDHAGRVLEQVTRGPSSQERVTYAYDDAGRLVERAWHDGDDVLTESYVYHCR